MSFIDPDHHDYPYASGCCEADHNRDDGHTFVHFYRPTDDWNNRYLINVAAFDKLNTGSSTYNGPYTITMTDITGTEKVATNLYLGTRIESTLPRSTKVSNMRSRSLQAIIPPVTNSTEFEYTCHTTRGSPIWYCTPTRPGSQGTVSAIFSSPIRCNIIDLTRRTTHFRSHSGLRIAAARRF